MKKLSTFLCLAGLLCLSSSVRAYDFKNGALYYDITSNAEPYTAAVTYEKQYAADNYAGISELVIPETVENEGITYSVTSIRDYAFYLCAGLTSGTIPGSIASIGEFAFTNCKALTAITVAPGNPTYDSRKNCNAIVETGTHTLRVGCSTTVIPESVTSIGDAAFNNCTGLTSITIPEGVTSIGNNAFYCTGLTSVSIPGSVTSIGNGAFNSCTDLTSVTIPGSVTSIGNSAFYTCTDLTLVTISEGVTSIETSAFGYCTKLTSITIPESVTSIGNNAFYGTGLTSVTIPEGVANIGDRAFSNCKALTAIAVATGNPTYDSRNNCNAIVETSTHTLRVGCSTITIPEGVTSIGNHAFHGCAGLTSVTIPEGVTSIGDHAFSNCTSLTSVTIPEGVASIGDHAFSLCTGIETIISYAATPPACGIYAFDQVPAEANVYVPCDAVEAYKSDATWRQFTGIRCIEDIPSAMEHTDTEPAAVQKTVLEGKVVILREGKTYDLLGREVR